MSVFCSALRSVILFCVRREMSFVCLCSLLLLLLRADGASRSSFRPRVDVDELTRSLSNSSVCSSQHNCAHFLAFAFVSAHFYVTFGSQFSETIPRIGVMFQVGCVAKLFCSTSSSQFFSTQLSWRKFRSFVINLVPVPLNSPNGREHATDCRSVKRSAEQEKGFR